MQAFTKLPRFVLVLEGAGIIMLILSYLSLHQMLRLPALLTGSLAATVMLFIGIALMLPAAALLMWRTAKAMAPELFNVPGRHRSGDKHDADH